MNCRSCQKEIPDDALCCCYCGTKVPDLRNLGENYRSPYGLWKVTTEGDCEGRTTKQLGIFEGYIDEIARTLVEGPCYSYQFEFVKPTEAPKDFGARRKAVSVTLSIESKTWDLNPEERAVIVSRLFEGRPVRVVRGNYFASFMLEFEN